MDWASFIVGFLTCLLVQGLAAIFVLSLCAVSARADRRAMTWQGRVP